MSLLSEVIASLVAGLLLGERWKAGPLALLAGGLAVVLAALATSRGTRDPSRSRWSWRILTMASLVLAGWARSPGLVASGSAGGSNPPFRRTSQSLSCLDPVRAVFEEAAARSLSGHALSLYRGMVLGQRDEFDGDLLEAMKRAGTTHLLAVSGLNVAVLVVALDATFRLARFTPMAAAALAIPSVFFYALVVGGDAPVMRAAVMGAFMLGGRLVGRGTTAAHSLVLSAIFLLIVRPLYLRDAGFQLSFAAVGALIAAGSWLSKRDAREGTEGAGSMAARAWIRVLRFVRAAFGTTLVAQAGVFPLILGLDGRASFVAPLANLAAVPPSGLVVPVGLLLPAAVAVSRDAEEIVSAVLWLLTRIVEVVSTWTASWPWATVTLGAPPGWTVALYYGGWLLFLSAGKTRWPDRLRWSGLAVVLVMTAVMALRSFVSQGGALPTPEARITFLDVGQGDACIVRTSRGRTLLVDAGPRSRHFDAGRSRVLPWMRRHAVRRIDGIVLTHAHLDHDGGLPALLRNIPVGTFFDGGEIAASREYLEVLVTLAERGVDYRIPGEGDVIFDDGVATAIVVHSRARPGRFPATTPRDLNDSSLGLRVACEGRTAFLLGDLGQPRQKRLISSIGAHRCVLIAAPHHGSRDATPVALLERARPPWVVISAGRRNRFGFPHQETLDAIERIGAAPWITGRDGDVTLVLGAGGAELRGNDGDLVARSR